MNYAKQLLDGIMVMHAIGYIHRDLKPENVMLTWNGTFVVSELRAVCLHL